MAVITSQQLSTYYELYRSIEVTFTKEVSTLLGFAQEHVMLKIFGVQWHCVLYSSSLESAKIILNLKAEQIEKLRTGSNLVALRYAFRTPDKTEPLTFFANGRVKGFSRYNSSPNPDLYFMTVDFSQRPSDDLIEILGRFLEANVNSQKRRDVRIPVNEVTIRKIGFTSCSTIIAVENVDRKCLVRDLSFGGALVLVPGVAKFLEGRKAALRLVLDDSGQTLTLPGKLVRVTALEGRRDITQAAMQFDEAAVPHAYKLKLNDTLRLMKPAAQG